MFIQRIQYMRIMRWKLFGKEGVFSNIKHLVPSPAWVLGHIKYSQIVSVHEFNVLFCCFNRVVHIWLWKERKRKKKENIKRNRFKLKRKFCWKYKCYMEKEEFIEWKYKKSSFCSIFLWINFIYKVFILKRFSIVLCAKGYSWIYRCFSSIHLWFFSLEFKYMKTDFKYI